MWLPDIQSTPIPIFRDGDASTHPNDTAAHPNHEVGGFIQTGCVCGLLIAAVLLLAEDLMGNGIGWFWRVIMVALLMLARRMFSSRSRD